MNTSMLKVLAISAVTATVALTGCSAKRTGTSEVVVAPMGLPAGGYYGTGYNGGAVVTNSVAVVNAASANEKAVYFAFDSSALDSQAQAVLDQHAALLKASPEARVQISGHTDERGSREYNMALGERRAKAAQSYLGTTGVSPNQLEAVSYGKEMPINAGHDENAWKENRRVEINYEAVPPLLK